MLRLAGALFLSLLLAGCNSGRDFERPTGASLTLGSMTEADVKARFGEPEDIAQQILPTPTKEQLEAVKSPFDPMPVEGQVTRYNYDFFQRGFSSALGDANSFKSANFQFLNGRLVDYEFISNAKETSTKFDEGKISLIQKGVSTREDIVRIFGEPSGYSIHPVIRDKGNTLISYSYIDFDRGSFGNPKNDMLLSFLQILVGPDGKVVDFRFKSGSQALPQAPAPAIMPIFIPTN